MPLPLLEDPDSLVFPECARGGRSDDRLDVDVVRRQNVVDGKVPALAADGQFALPDAVRPVG